MSHCHSGRMEERCRVRALAAILLLPLLMLAVSLSSEPAEAKTPGKTYCFVGKCHRVKTIEETRKLIGHTVTLKTSHYDDPKRDRFNPSLLTSSGEYFRSDRPDNAASPIFPDGTRLLIWNPATKQTAVVRINNAGPYMGQRNLDVSRATAERLGFARQGVATLKAKILAAPTPAEATYRKGRTYDPVPGHIGTFESIDTAMLSVGRSIYNIFKSPVDAIAGREPAPAASQGTAVASASAAGRGASGAVSAQRASAVRVAAVRRPVRARAATRVAAKAGSRAVRVAALQRSRSVLRERAARRLIASRGGVRVASAGRQRLADLDETRPIASSGRCRPGTVAMRARDGGRQARLVCVSAVAPDATSSRSSARSLRMAALRNRS